MIARGQLLPGLATAAVVAAFDQALKAWILLGVMTPPRIIEVTPFFNLVMAWNRGVSFGLFGDGGTMTIWLLAGLAVAIVGALVYWLATAERRFIGIALGLVIGGAAGNLIDRIRFGAVADFLDLHLFGYHWPAFNLADAAITLGAAMLILDALFGRSEKSKKEPVQGADGRR